MAAANDVATVVHGLESDEESVRKLAAFHLQSLIAEPGQADAFVAANGCPALCWMLLHDNGNTLAYALGSLTGVLEQGHGWASVSDEMLARIVDLVVGRPVINVLRNAFHLLVLVVGRQPPLAPSTSPGKQPSAGPTLDNLKPILKEQRTFLESLVDKLSSADYALCAHALQLLNALLRDGITTFSETQLMRFIKRLQDLQAFTGVENIMRGGELEHMAPAVLDFQTLTRVLLRCWRFIPVDVGRSAHRDAFHGLQHVAIKSGYRVTSPRLEEGEEGQEAESARKEKEKAAPWRALGFSSNDPTGDLADMGLLGLMDLTDFVTKHSDFVKKTLLEQSVLPEEQRCPLARVCLAVTRMLFQHFGVDSASASPRSSALIQSDLDMAIRPLLLARDRLHGALSHAFFRLWASAEATVPEFDRIQALVEILLADTVGKARRRVTTQEVEDRIGQITLRDLRRWQLDDIEARQEQAWGPDLDRLKDRLHDDATHFVQEQRIRCLLQGAWFPSITAASTPSSRPSTPSDPDRPVAAWHHVRLAPSRRHLHHVTFPRKPPAPPALADMPQRINVAHMSSVTSTAVAGTAPEEARGGRLSGGQVHRLVIHGGAVAAGLEARRETELLELHCVGAERAAEWSDGLLMLLEQRAITAETERWIGVVEGWGLKVRMLNLHLDGAELESGGWRGGEGEGGDWGRTEEVEGEYWYDMGEA